jgi:hypothetical protein
MPPRDPADCHEGGTSPRDRRQRVARLERSCRRPLGDGVIHHDQCDGLTLHGVRWAVPPRGRRIVFDLGPHRPVARLEVTEDGEGVQAVRRAVPRGGRRRCRVCGRPRIARAELLRADGFLSAAAELAGRLLRRQYELTDEQLAELLSFPADTPAPWLSDLLRWCGLDTEPGAAPPRRRGLGRLWPWKENR